MVEGGKVMEYTPRQFATLAKTALYDLFVVPAFGMLWLVSPDGRYGHALNFCMAVWYDGLRGFFYEPQAHQFYRGQTNWRFWMLVM